MSHRLPQLDRSYRKKEDLKSSQEDPRAEFYERYHREGELYDKEFLKKHGEDLDTTLIFVRCVRFQAHVC